MKSIQQKVNNCRITVDSSAFCEQSDFLVCLKPFIIKYWEYQIKKENRYQSIRDVGYMSHVFFNKIKFT